MWLNCNMRASVHRFSYRRWRQGRRWERPDDNWTEFWGFRAKRSRLGRRPSRRLPAPRRRRPKLEAKEKSGAVTSARKASRRYEKLRPRAKYWGRVFSWWRLRCCSKREIARLSSSFPATMRLALSARPTTSGYRESHTKSRGCGFIRQSGFELSVGVYIVSRLRLICSFTLK